MAEQDVDSDYPDRGGPVEEPPAQHGRKEETLEHKVPPDDEEEEDVEKG
jgi:hypothetical protein